MVIHEESESPVEIAVIRKPEILEPKKYLMINNHIRELPDNGDSPPDSSPEASKDLLPSDNESRGGKNSSKKSKKRKIESEEDLNPTQISESDLLELRTVYQNCLNVINKIESKYGHLLHIDSPGCSFRYDHSADNGDERSNSVCNCKRKKIVFDDDGHEHTQEIEDHICPKMPKRFATAVCSVMTNSEDFSLSLPDDLPSLAGLLRNPNLDHRSKVIDKIRTIRQDHVNELRFNRPALIQALKRDPEQVLGFKGVNLASLPGYH